MSIHVPCIEPSLTVRDREGVASVVGTILALIVFLSLLGIFINHYVPSIMAGNEHEHDNDVIAQISQLKESIDSMLLYYSSSGQATLSSYNPVTLGSSGVPMFAAGTQSEMVVIPYAGMIDPSFTVTFTYAISTSNGQQAEIFNGTSGGGVVVNIPNRYYIPQSILYQNDAVIVGQSNGEVMVADPGFTVSNHGGLAVNILESVIQTPSSQNVSYSGTQTVGINAQLLSYSTVSLAPLSAISLYIMTPFPYAWENFFNSTFDQAGLLPVTSSPGNYTFSLNQLGLKSYMLELRLFDVAHISVTRAVLSLGVEE